MTRVELCEALAVDYAKKASVLSIKFDDAYEKYLKRCELRSYDNLLQQFTVGNIGSTIKKITNRSEEYVIIESDDDCEDGVCKL
jgi:hypothetical protein|tara:strand:- start:246 stop:497 length:252 start_codon:yes stop_codon:yes gene_type:complete